MDSGLEGVVAAQTVLSHSDGGRGIMWVRGHTLGELVADYGFEGAVGVLWEGFAGDGLSRGRDWCCARRGPGRGLRRDRRLARPRRAAAVARGGAAGAGPIARGQHAHGDPGVAAGGGRGAAADEPG